MISHEKMAFVLDRLPALRIGLVGDLFLDRYLMIETGVQELSIETGLEAYQIGAVCNAPGALGTVMNNLAALGVGHLVPVSVIGDDGHGDDLMRELKNLPVEPKYLIRDPERLTPTYTKPLRTLPGGEIEELSRLDFRDRQPLSEATTRQVCDHLSEIFSSVDGLIVSDQVVESDWGVVNRQVRRHIGELTQAEPDKWIVVDSRAHMGEYDFGVLKPNDQECLLAAGTTAPTDQNQNDTAVREAALRLSEKTQRPVFCTRGPVGMLVVRPDKSIEMAHGYPSSGPIDIVGAGDSATAGIVVALLSGASDIEAADMGNLVASITVQKLGTTGTASPDELLARRKSTLP